MPSKADLLFLHHQDERSTTTTTTSTQDFFARDVDLLVAEIKENLRLRARPSSSANCKQRVSPYKVPGRDSSSKCHSCGSPKCLRTCLKKPAHDSSDPYELLQMLLREGSLIKEAVKRLQTAAEPPDAAAAAATKEDKIFYDDDCDSNSPLSHLVHLEF